MIEVLQSGTRTTLQDAGRPGSRHLGIPQSGAADRLSFALANWMVGNKWNMPGLECTLGGLHLKFHDAAIIGLAGAEMWAQVNGQNINNFTSFPVQAGDILTLSFARKGCRAYIAVAGGLDGDHFLGSVSTYRLGAIGGLEGRALQTGDRFFLKDVDQPRQTIPPGFEPRISNHAVLRAGPGPEYFDMTLASQRHLFISPFHATAQTDRMGARLKGDKISLSKPGSMTSGPMLPGTLQIPPAGGPVLALVDGHCTGGYARVLQVIKADHWIMGQIGPGMQVSFNRCFEDEAPRILKRRTAFYRGLMDGFEF